VITTVAPTAPLVTERLVIVGVGRTVKLTPLLPLLETVTTTFPVVAPLGTVTPTLVALQLVAVAVVPLNVTVLVPWVVPKFDPVMVTEAPTAPEVWERLDMVGPAASAPTGKKSRMEIVRIKIGIQLRRRIRASLHGFEVEADRTGLALTKIELFTAIIDWGKRPSRRQLAALSTTSIRARCYRTCGTRGFSRSCL
jgi:hypothetical protein